MLRKILFLALLLIAFGLAGTWDYETEQETISRLETESEFGFKSNN